MIVKARSIRCRWTDKLYAGELTQNIGEQTVGEMTRWWNDWLLWDLELLDSVT